jgi:hypothetical protein
MFNRLQAIRAAVFGISFVILCLFIGMLLVQPRGNKSEVYGILRKENQEEGE